MCWNVVFFKYFKVITFILVTGLFTSFGVVLAQTEGSKGWDFSGEQQPSFDLLWPYEDRIAGYLCPVQIKKIYDNYVVQNPAFRPHLNNESMRREFRRSLLLGAKEGERYLGSCFEDMLAERIRTFRLENRVSEDPLVLPFHYLLEVIGWKRKPRNLYCGVLANNLDEEEFETALALEELTEYAFAENRYVTWLVLWQDRDTKFFRYNPDIRYYFQLLLKKLGRAEWLEPETKREIEETNAPLMLPLEELSSQRRKFVEYAFERGDYKAVLETTDPC